jgi:hypothetical protein
MSHEKIIEDFKIIEGFQKARIGSLKGARSQPLQRSQHGHRERTPTFASQSVLAQVPTPNVPGPPGSSAAISRQCIPWHWVAWTGVA